MLRGFFIHRKAFSRSRIETLLWRETGDLSRNRDEALNFRQNRSNAISFHLFRELFRRCSEVGLTTESSNLGRLIKNNYTNIALLKDLMTIPPMTAQQHAEIMRKRIAHRRMLEEAKELKTASEDIFKEQ
jgi:hypothetical protein